MNDTALLACGSVVGLDALIPVLLWLAAAVFFLGNFPLMLVQSRTSILVHAVFASLWVAFTAALWRSSGDLAKGLFARLSFEFGIYLVPICVISQFVVLVIQTIRGGRYRKQAVEMT
jgi:hypothetical protein